MDRLPDRPLDRPVSDVVGSLATRFARLGYQRMDVPLLQPADVFVDLSGEDIRRRLFLTQDAAGRELCLRPEFTIPVCRAWLASGATGANGAARPVNMSCVGPVFRHRQGESGEFLQAGLESLGRADPEAADAEIVALACDASEILGLAQPRMRLGDGRMLALVLEALAVPAPLARRIRRELAAGRLPGLTTEPTGDTSAGGYGAVLAALEEANPVAARAFVEDMLAVAGVSDAAGRSSAEIADRFLDKARGGGMELAAGKAAVLLRFLGIAGDPDAVAHELRRLDRDESLGLGAAIASYEARIGFMAARGIEIGRIEASTAFARNLDYYTGMVFELTDPDDAGGKPLVAGGRYDGLLQKLGAPAPVPAVGCAIWIERFGAVAARRNDAPNGEVRA